jgi:hypothetical protein
MLRGQSTFEGLEGFEEFEGFEGFEEFKGFEHSVAIFYSESISDD